MIKLAGHSLAVRATSGGGKKTTERKVSLEERRSIAEGRRLRSIKLIEGERRGLSRCCLLAEADSRSVFVSIHVIRPRAG